MATLELKANFEPESLKAFMKNEVKMRIGLKNTDPEHIYWCEADILAKAPLSLASDMPLENGRIRVGILKHGTEVSRTINLYTLPNNFPDQYPVKFTVYLYDEEGVIHERLDETRAIDCKDMHSASKEEVPTPQNGVL